MKDRFKRWLSGIFWDIGDWAIEWSHKLTPPQDWKSMKVYHSQRGNNTYWWSNGELIKQDSRSGYWMASMEGEDE